MRKTSNRRINIILNTVGSIIAISQGMLLLHTIQSGDRFDIVCTIIACTIILATLTLINNTSYRLGKIDTLNKRKEVHEDTTINI